MANGAYRVVTACRLCDSEQLTETLNLGETPLANELGPPAHAKGICPFCQGFVYIRQGDRPEEMMCFACGIRWDGFAKFYLKEKYTDYLPLPPTELFPLIVNRCTECEHHQLSIAVNPERLWGKDYPYQSGTSPVFRKHLEALADEVAALKPGGNVFEIGANDGTLLEMLADRDLVASGCDPSGSGRVYTASWPLKLSPKRDVILALNVFAHVDDLHSFTAAVKEALAPDGVFIVEVGYFPYVCEDGLFDTVYHEHMSYHAARPLKRFFARHGLSLVRWVTNDSQGGSIRCYVRHSGDDSVGLDEDGESNAWLLRERMVLTKTGLVLALRDAGTVAGYGAPAKLTTLMYATGLEHCIARVYDDNPLKVGKLTPGTLIPIVPSANLVADAPDTLILFAWNFASEIIPRLRAQGYKGRIITPLPEVEVDEL